MMIIRDSLKPMMDTNLYFTIVMANVFVNKFLKKCVFFTSLQNLFTNWPAPLPKPVSDGAIFTLLTLVASDQQTLFQFQQGIPA